MKINFLLLFGFVACLSYGQNQKSNAKGPAALESDAQKTSYSFGVLIAANLKNSAVNHQLLV